MKKFSILFFLLLLLIILIPFVVGVKNKESPIKEDNPSIASPDEINTHKLSSEETDYIACNAMMYINEDTHKETKKAILGICYNNYIYEKENNLASSELKIENYSDKLLKELNKALKNFDFSITYNNKRVYIPLNESSCGYIATDDEFPYISSVASPWDVFHKDYDKNAVSESGISVAGINYLCENGYDYIKALKWYLPKLKINN